MQRAFNRNASSPRAGADIYSDTSCALVIRLRSIIRFLFPICVRRREGARRCFVVKQRRLRPRAFLCRPRRVPESGCRGCAAGTPLRGSCELQRAAREPSRSVESTLLASLRVRLGIRRGSRRDRWTVFYWNTRGAIVPEVNPFASIV